jgi:hypothetical protein
LEELVQLISQRVGRCLERQGLLEQDTESAWLDLEPAEDTDAMPQILGSSISYRIAVGPQQGRKAFMIRTIRPLDRPDPRLERVAKANGFSTVMLFRDSACPRILLGAIFCTISIRGQAASHWAHRLDSHPISISDDPYNITAELLPDLSRKRNLTFA